MSTTLEIALYLAIVVPVAVGFTIVLAYFVIGLPGIGLKRLGGRLFAKGRDDLVDSSIKWARRVSIGFVLLHYAAVVLSFLLSMIVGRVALSVLSGYAWTAIEVGLLAALAVGFDIGKVLARSSPGMGPMATVGFLVLSNAWVLGGGFLLMLFNGNVLFTSCYMPNGEIVDTMAVAKPPQCIIP